MSSATKSNARTPNKEFETKQSKIIEPEHLINSDSRGRILDKKIKYSKTKSEQISAEKFSKRMTPGKSKENLIQPIIDTKQVSNQKNLDLKNSSIKSKINEVSEPSNVNKSENKTKIVSKNLVAKTQSPSSLIPLCASLDDDGTQISFSKRTQRSKLEELNEVAGDDLPEEHSSLAENTKAKEEESDIANIPEINLLNANPNGINTVEENQPDLSINNNAQNTTHDAINNSNLDAALDNRDTEESINKGVEHTNDMERIINGSDIIQEEKNEDSNYIDNQAGDI